MKHKERPEVQTLPKLETSSRAGNWESILGTAQHSPVPALSKPCKLLQGTAQGLGGAGTWPRTGDLYPSSEVTAP